MCAAILERVDLAVVIARHDDGRLADDVVQFLLWVTSHDPGQIRGMKDYLEQQVRCPSDVARDTRHAFIIAAC